ncbi:unnamed protein product [Closterium sp. Yama58-4]|nr:unnamed protein product [Closterium sp. Yama58-4]
MRVFASASILRIFNTLCRTLPLPQSASPTSPPYPSLRASLMLPSAPLKLAPFLLCGLAQRGGQQPAGGAAALSEAHDSAQGCGCTGQLYHSSSHSPAGPYIPSHLTSYEDPMIFLQSAFSAPNGSIFLTSTPSTAPWGAAFTPQPSTLFLSTNSKQPCDQPIAFSVSFAFQMTPAAPTSGGAATGAGSTTTGEGLAFVITAAAPQGAAVGVGLGGVGKRSVAVEFDSVLSVKHSDPNDNHVGVNVGGSPVSLASATAPLILNDAHTKHAWIHYDPTSGGTLRVFLSASRQQPSKAVLTARVSLCSALKPTMGNSSFLFGFVAASTNYTQRHDILSWKIITGVLPVVDWKNEVPGKAFGQVASSEEVAGASERENVPSTFHYASLAFQTDSPATEPPYSLMVIALACDQLSSNRMSPPCEPPTLPLTSCPSSNAPPFMPLLPSCPSSHAPPFMPLLTCSSLPLLAADSSAYAVVAAVEAAYSIASNWSQPPRLSVDQLRLALSSNCDDMPPRDVLAFLVAATRKGGGLVDDAAAAPASPHSMASAGRRERLAAISNPLATCFASALSSILPDFVILPFPVLQKVKYYGIQGFEESSFDGWLGLLLAVQRQPVVVRIEASAQSFFEYDGTYKYADAGCFQEGVNHAVLLVGYALQGSTSSPFSLDGPLWVIRNSWGTGWGDVGHMYMDMQSGPGVCGINTLPGIFPILRSTADPCGSKSVMLEGSSEVPGSNAFNPCGQFKCSKAGASNRCACAAPHFVQTSHPDGSNTCAYVDACGLAGSNPCVVGTCVNDGKGSYSCVCPPGFVQGTTAKGTLSCAPGDNKGSYTVLGSNVWCSQVLPVFGLTLNQLKQQNKVSTYSLILPPRYETPYLTSSRQPSFRPSCVQKISCTKPIPVGFKLTVKTTQSFPNCSLFYTIQSGESCVRVAQQFNLSDSCLGDGDQACVDAVVGLNPGLNCSELRRGQAVCIERDESRAGEVAVCDKEYLVQECGGCDAVMVAVDPPLSPLEFYRLNRGINCNCLSTNLQYHYLQRKVCVASSTRYKTGKCPGSTYSVAAGDSCDVIDVKGFAGIKGPVCHISIA